MKKLFNLIKRIPKIYLVIFMSFIVLLSSIIIPTLSKHRNQIDLDNVTYWDGTVAISFHGGTGTDSDPYIISNGNELAYLASELENNNYENTYFKLDQNIALNSGLFSYDGTDIKYETEGNYYYIKPYTNEYYDTDSFDNLVGTVHTFNPLNNFKGHIDCDGYTIYGLYITSDTAKELALFTNLSGEVKDLYLENEFIYGGAITAGLASTSDSSTIKNILVKGYIVGTTSQIHNYTIDLDDMIATIKPNEGKTFLFDIPEYYGEMTSSHIIGNINITDYEGLIAGICGYSFEGDSFDFDILKKTNIYTSLSNYRTEDVTFELTNLVYEATYKDEIATSIVGVSTNDDINGVIDRANIYGNTVSGLAGETHMTSITNGYVDAPLIGNSVASGFITINQEDTSLSNLYMAVEMTGPNRNGIAKVSKYGLELQNVVLLTDYTKEIDITDYNITRINYYSSKSTGNKYIDSNNFNNETYMTSIGFTSEEGWVYENSNSAPLLFFDDILTPIASINISSDSWNIFNEEPIEKLLNTNTSFSISEIDYVRPVKEAYYYISTSRTPLTLTEVEEITEWEEYTSVVALVQEGYYTVYAKVLDSTDEVYYINSDIIVIDKTGASITINANNREFTSLVQNSNVNYFNEDIDISISAYDALAGVDTLEYYYADSILDTSALDEIDEWLTYTDCLTYTDNTKTVLYVKAKDNTGLVTYASTGYIIKDGIVLSNVYYGKSMLTTDTVFNISYKSSMTFKYTYTDTIGLNTTDSTAIKSDMLPVGTVITIQSTNTLGKLVITDSINEDFDGYYRYSLFKTYNLNEEEYLSNDTYTLNNERNFIINVDFKNTDIEIDTTYAIALVILRNNNVLIDTYESDKKSINVFIDGTARFSLTTDYDRTPINYNSDSTTTINVSTGITYKRDVVDTTYENKKVGLELRMIDGNSLVVNKEYLKNIIVSVNDVEYAPNSKGVYRIDLNRIQMGTDVLKIITSTDNIKLPNGNYSFWLNTYITDDGITESGYTSLTTTIPVSLSSNYKNNNYVFSVECEDESKILIKSNQTAEVNYQIKVKDIANPSVRVSLYEKDTLSGYDQEYTKINLQDYILESLTLVDNNVYTLIANPINYIGRTSTINSVDLTFVTSLLNNKAYKLVFELYSGDTQISVIEKNFIVK